MSIIKKVFSELNKEPPTKKKTIGLFNIINISPEEAQKQPQLAPAEINGYELTYHYQDVRLNVPWQLGGGYGKSINSIGVKRGDPLKIVLNTTTVDKETDLENISIMWGKTIIGDMRPNRLRDMVHTWLQEGLPIYCGVTLPADDRRFYIEFGLYGNPKYKKAANNDI